MKKLNLILKLKVAILNE